MASFMILTSCSSVSSTVKNSDETTNNINEVESNTDIESESGDITLTYLASSQIFDAEAKLIEDFNAADNGYKIEVISYSDMYEYTPLEGDPDFIGNPTDDSVRSVRISMMQAISSGKIDIISNGAVDVSTFNIFMGQGAFVDLYDFMENDPEINTSTLDAHILEAYETNGKLYCYPMLYGFRTLFGFPEYVGTKENLSVDEFIELWDNMPEGSTICGANTQKYIYNHVLREQFGSFVDYKTGKVTFDSPEFIRLLEFCGSFYPDNEEKQMPDYDAVNMALASGASSFSSFAQLCRDPYSTNEDHDVTFIGYPSDCGRNAFLTSKYSNLAINSQTSVKKQKGAWEYIRLLSSEEYQYDLGTFYDKDMDRTTQQGFPINHAAYDRILEDHMNRKIDGGSYTASGVAYELEIITPEEAERLKKYVNNINAIDNPLDSDLSEMLAEETLLYFNGAQSVEQTAMMLQNRAEIYISELQ